MNHPTPQARLDLLAPAMRNETQISALLEMENRRSDMSDVMLWLRPTPAEIALLLLVLARNAGPDIGLEVKEKGRGG